MLFTQVVFELSLQCLSHLLRCYKRSNLAEQ